MHIYIYNIYVIYICIYIYVDICTGTSIYEQPVSFFHHIPSSLTLSISLLHCFDPETSFVVDLKFYSGDTEGALAFHKSRLGKNLLAFLSILLYNRIVNTLCIISKEKKVYVIMLISLLKFSRKISKLLWMKEF